MNSPYIGQWGGALLFCLICAWINGWVNNNKAGNLRRHHAHYDVTVMNTQCLKHITTQNLAAPFTGANGTLLLKFLNLSQPLTHCGWVTHTVETLYSMIYYSKYFIELNIDKSTQYVALWTHKRPHTSPFRASYGVSFMSTSTEIDRVIKGFYCIYISTPGPDNRHQAIIWTNAGL